jgi:hypothetical protein
MPISDALARHAPIVWVHGMPLADVIDQAADDRIGGDEAERGVDQRADARLDEGLRFHGRDDLGAVDGHSVVADAGGAACQVGRPLGVARADHGPAVDEDLGADLLGHLRAVELEGAAARRRDAVLQAQVGGMLGGVAQAAPPEDGAALDDVVEPGLADLGGGERRAVAVVGQGAQEGEGAGDVVVGDDQGAGLDLRIAPLVHVVGDLAQLGHDTLVRPALEGAAQVDADDLAEHAGVDTLGIVGRKCHLHPFRPTEAMPPISRRCAK